MNNNNCNCNTTTPCGNETPISCGCRVKQDLLCTFYSGEKLVTLNINPGTDGNTVVKKINDYLENLSTDGGETDDILIESTGGKLDIYSGISPAAIHQVRTIEGEPNGGVIVELKGPETSCDDGSFINVKIDKDWIRNHVLNLLINEYDLCDLISGCGTTIPPNNAPTTVDIIFNLPNRGTKTFTGTDFPFTDVNGDTLSAVKVIGAVGDYTFNGQPYTSDTEVTIADVQQGKFKFVGQDTNLAYQSVAQFKLKDSQNNWSTANVITINIAAKVIAQLEQVSLSFLRGVTTTKTATINYTNGNAQSLVAGDELYSIGAIGQPGYIKVYVQNDATLTSMGTFNIVVVAHPYNTVGGNPSIITYNLPQASGTGIINLTYMSSPENEDVNLSTQFMTPIPFTPTMLTAFIEDLDNDAQQVRINPATPDNLAGYFYNGNPYTGQWIDIADLGNITFIPDNIPAGYFKSNAWQVKDSQGNVST